jgi:hypothetical protein
LPQPDFLAAEQLSCAKANRIRRIAVIVDISGDRFIADAAVVLRIDQPDFPERQVERNDPGSPPEMSSLILDCAGV